MVFSAIDKPPSKATTRDVTRAEHAPERRKNTRVPVHWTVILGCTGTGRPLRTMTRDISRDGFYCLIDQPVPTGEQIACDIVVPTFRPEDPDEAVYLRCYGRVVRVEKIAASTNYGLAFRIETYRVLHGLERAVGAGQC